ncbi:MAG: FAD-binding oxidoreductase [Thermoleophilia bacterium]|nr:FAD-binding oxidoreductase [Thermoleophilia bacterium]
MNDGRHLLLDLAREARGEVRGDTATRELYAVDASLYRRCPTAVLRAGHVDDLALAVDTCARHRVPLTMRGGGTSLAGQALGTGLVVDTSALRGIEVDPGSRTARVQPGVVLDDLNRAAAVHGLTFGPDVATSSRATLGGMIGNNSSGARSVVYGTTADHLVELDVVLANGTAALLRRGGPVPAPLTAARAFATADGFPSLMRRVSGYALDAIAGPDPDWPRLICGSEGTLAVLRSATVRLVAPPKERALVLISFPDMDTALQAVPGLLQGRPSAIELMDGSLLDPANRAAPEAALLRIVGRAPAMLMVEYSGEPGEATARAQAHSGATVLTDPRDQAAAWTIRRTGIARALRVTDDEKPIPFIEDPAVPPENLAAFAREVRHLLTDAGMGDAIWYGHASVGCLHIRPTVDLRAPGAVATMRQVAEGVADIVHAHGGSLSGEHGDGRLRGELLPRMYSPDMIDRFQAVKYALDPLGILNPGIIIHPEPLDSGLRIAVSPAPHAIPTAVSFEADGGLQRAIEACNGNGQCRRSDSVMCPSYQALRDERHSTRGRAVLLRAAIEGRLELGLADPGLHEALDLCLSCHACATECPAGVDMSRLKVEALVARHAEQRPGLLTLAAAHAHDLLRAGSTSPRLAERISRRAERRLGRPVPTPTRAWRPPPPSGNGVPLALFADTFTRFLEPATGDAAVRVLTTAGAHVAVLAGGCCGRPALSQGMPDLARTQGRHLLRTLHPATAQGRPIVVLEPSCLSMLAADLPWLLPDDPRATRVADAVISFERAVVDLGCEIPTNSDAPLVHRHCHSRAVGDTAAVAALGPHATATDAGCCGMAGAFGYQHPDVSRLIGEDRLAPAIRAATGPVVAAGVSCRHQIADLTGTDAVHPAVHLDRLLHT